MWCCDVRGEVAVLCVNHSGHAVGGICCVYVKMDLSLMRKKKKC